MGLVSHLGTLDLSYTKGWAPRRTCQFLHLDGIMAVFKGGEDTRREAINGRLSGRGRESYEREKYSYRWRNVQEMMPELFNSNSCQLMSSLSFLYLVFFALFKHFALIQRSKIITSLNDVTKCKNLSYEINEVPTLEVQMFDFTQIKILNLPLP